MNGIQTRWNAFFALTFFLVFLPPARAAGTEETAGETAAKVLTLQSSEFERDLRSQGFVFGGGGSMSDVGSAIFELGGGFDWIFYEGLGVGFEISVLGDSTGGLGTAGLNLSYHFLPDGPGLEPFVVVGMSFGSPVESGLDGYTWATGGGGINYWFGNGMALRLEVRGRYDLDYDSHMVGIRVGLTF
jgi:hypothetical protein